MSAADVSGRVYNIACGRRITVNRLVGELEELMGAEARLVYAEERPGEVRDSLADIGRARAELGYSPSTELREGLLKTMADAAP
jgi:nucleoside-diphosphate-sugar epimerase